MNIQIPFFFDSLFGSISSLNLSLVPYATIGRPFLKLICVCLPYFFARIRYHWILFFFVPFLVSWVLYLVNMKILVNFRPKNKNCECCECCEFKVWQFTENYKNDFYYTIFLTNKHMKCIKKEKSDVRRRRRPEYVNCT